MCSSLSGAAHILVMSTATILRQPKGAPIGGEFAAHAHTEAEIVLTADGGLTEPAEKSVFRRRYDSPEEKVKAFMAELETQVTELQTDAGWQEYLDVMSKFHNYSFNNQMLIAIQSPEATRVAGYNKWIELGRQVRKGESGIAILAPRKTNVIIKDAAGNPLLDAAGKPRKEHRVVGFTSATVFDISQTDGPDLPDNRMHLTEEPPDGLIEDLTAAVKTAGFTVEVNDQPHGTNLGFTTTDGSRRVVIQAGMSAGSTARTLAHELGHIAAGHIDTDRHYHTGPGGERGAMEVEADSISYALLRSNGMSPEVGRANASYVSGWGEKDATSVKAAAGVVSKAVKDLFSSNTWRNAA